MVQSVLQLHPVIYMPVQPTGHAVAAAGPAVTVQMAAALVQADLALLEAGASATRPGPAAEPTSPAAQAIKAAVAQAAGVQGGLAPLMADLRQAVESLALAPPLKAAAQQVLALQTPLSPKISAPALRQAVAQSGLFLEARLAATPEAPPGPDLKAALLVLRQVLAAAAPGPKAMGDGAPRPPTTAAPAAPQSAPASQAAGQPPHPARSAPESEIARQRNPGPARTAPQAPTSAPLDAPGQGAAAPEQQLAERGSAAPSPRLLSGPAPTARRPAPAGQEGGSVLAASSAGSEARVPQQARPEQSLSRSKDAGRSAPEPAIQQSAISKLPPTAETQRSAAVALPPPARAPSARETPPPPYRGGPTHAQRPAASTLGSIVDAPAIAERLLQETRAALARSEMLQAASLPNGPPTSLEAGPTPRPEPRWTFDLPFATPQGPAVAQFEISRDGGGDQGPASGEAEPVWRARFSLDLEPTGPVHAALRLTGRRAAVTLWAERPERAAELRARVEELARGLRKAAETVDIVVYVGAPPTAAPASGRLVDRSS